MNSEYDWVKEFLSYNPETGVFTWIKERPRKIRVGDLAGSFTYKGYIQIRFNGRQYRAHRLAWFFAYGEMPKNQIDHINGVRHDNRICNLRDVTQAENSHNIKIRVVNTSGYTGVHWDKRDRKWRAQISVNNRVHHLGNFDNPEEAHRAYLKVKSKLHPTANLHLIAASAQHLPIIG